MKTPRLTREQFLASLKKSGLITGGDWERVLALLPNTGGGRELALALLKAGKLTRYQAEMLLAGKSRNLVVGQYVLLRLRGKGGLGKVFKAMHRTMNRVVALKVLAPQLIKTDKARELFQREIVAVGRLIHPNIATAFDANTTADRCYLVMEYVNGPDLERMVRRQGPVRPPVACEIIRQAALGLQYAFEMGMLHRDIKPANILLQRGREQAREPWTVKLVDFGLARLQAAGADAPTGLGTILTRDNTVMGTPDYLSPEQSRDLHQVDIRSDLYSLGCTFYFLLTGQPPFPGGTPLEKLIRHASEEPAALETLCPGVSPEIAQVVRRLMAKRPEDRYQTPAELARALIPLASVAPEPKVEGRKTRKTRTGKKRPGLKGGGTAKVRSDKKRVANPASRDTVPASLSPTPLPQANEGPVKPVEIPTEANRAPIGLFIALGMMAFIMLLAWLLSLL